MKKLIVILLLCICTITIATVYAAEVDIIKDTNLRNALIDIGVDTNNDGKITAKEAASCTWGLALHSKGIESIEGLEYFDNVDTLHLDKNNISNIEPLFGMDSLAYVALGANRINDTFMRDHSYHDKVEELRAKGVNLFVGNQQVDWDGTKITANTPKYRVLFVIAKETDFTVPTVEGGTVSQKYTMSETDIAFLKECARLFERYTEKLSDYAIDVVVDVYVTKDKITEPSEPGIAYSGMYSYPLWGSDIEEIASIYSHYDSTIVNAYMNDKMHDSSGVTFWNPATNRGDIFIPYDSTIYPIEVNNESLEKYVEEYKKDMVNGAEIDTFVHEFIHVLEGYGAANGLKMWEFHDALNHEFKEVDSVYEDTFDRMGMYLRGAEHPEHPGETGITPWIYENSPIKVETGSTAKPTTPELSVKLDVPTSKVTLSWTASDSVSYYRVYRSTKPTTEFELINKIPVGVTTCYEYRTEGTYYYKVEPVLSYPDKVIYGDESNVVNVTVRAMTPPQAPFISIKQGERRTLEISWEKDAYASGYYLYRAESENGTYTKIATITDASSYIDRSLTSGITYYYKLIAYNGYGWSEESNLVSEIAGVLDAPVLSIEKQGENTFKLTWTAVENATNYSVYRSLYKDGEYECPCSFDTLEYVEENVPKGTRYYYKVQASNANELYDPSEFSNIVTEAVPGDKVEGKPIVIILRNGPNAVKLMWNWIHGAEGYVVKRSTSENGTYVNIGTAPQKQLVEFIDEGLKTGTTYYYKVHAYNEWGVSEDSDVVFRLVEPLQPTTAYIEVYEENNFKLYWNTVNDAIGYKVYRSTSKNGTYELITTTSELEYHEQELPKGTTYYYKIISYSDKETSGFSNIVTASVERDRIPGAPVVEIAKGNNNSLVLSWEDVGFTDGYYVYYATSKTGKYTKLATVTGTSYTHKKLTYGKTYYYKVVAYNAYEKTGYSNVASMKVVPNEVTGLKLAQSGSTSVKLSWNKLANTGYAIYYSADGETWTYVARTTSNSYTHSGLKSNTEYYYRIRAYQLVSGAYVYGAYSSVENVVTAPAIPKISVATTANRSLNVTLGEVAGATTYEVYRMAVGEKAYTHIVTLGEVGTYEDKNLSVGKTYYYKVRARNEDGVVGTLSGYVSTVVSPVAVENVIMTSASSTAIKIKWDKTNATGYVVYRSTDNSKWTKVKTITKGATVTYLDSGLKANTTYYYKVRAYVTVGKTVIYGPYSESYSTKTAPTAPKITVSATLDKTLDVTIGSANGATKYEIYKLASGEKAYTLVATLTEAGTYNDKSVIVGKTYYYKVRAVNEEGLAGTYSPYVSRVVIPAKVANGEMTSAVSNAVKFIWDETEASGYEVYRSINNKKYAKVATITKGTTTAYLNKGLAANTTYYYKVRAYKTVGRTKIYGAFSPAIVTRTAPKTPAISVASLDYNSLNIVISAVKGAAKYEIYRSDSKSGSYELITELNTAGTYTDTNLQTGATYYYKVRALNSEGTATSYSTVKYAKVVPTQPKISISTTSKQIKVLVSNVEGIDGYEIYRATSKNGKYLLLETTMELETVAASKKGKTYYYKVRCFTLVDGVKVYSSYSKIKSIKSK